MKEFLYELKKGSRHILCPNCGKKTFKPFVHSGTNTDVDASKFGRCERIFSCGYFCYPDGRKKYADTVTQYKPEKIQKPDYVDKSIVESTFCNFRENVFFMWLVKLLGKDQAFELQERYNIGTAKNGGTIFWQQDISGNFRTGKIMYYGDDGKRLKNRASWFLHNKIKRDFVLQQVFFGEHLTGIDKPVALCESEKTAIVMSCWKPEFTWVSAGSANMLSVQRLSRLQRLDIIFPDHGQREKWEKQVKMFGDVKVDTSVDMAVLRGELPAGADILDLYEHEKNTLWI